MKYNNQPPTLEELQKILKEVDGEKPRESIKERKQTMVGFVYFITDGRYVKIGVSNNPEQRLHTLQTANASKLSLLKVVPSDNPYSLEAALHEHYADKHVNQEWYDILGDFKKKELNYLTLKDIEKLLNISHATAYKLMQDPKFPAIRIGKSIRVNESDFYNYMDLKKGLNT